MMKLRKSSVIVGFALALFVLLAGLSNSFLGLETMFNNIGGNQCAANSTNLGWISLSFIALVLAIMVTALGWVLSGGFAAQRYNDFLRERLWLFVEGMGVLAVFSLAFAGLQEYGTANIDTARTYATVIRNTAMFDFSAVMVANTFFSFFATINPTFRPSGAKLGFSFSFQLGPMFRPVFDLLGMLIQLMTASIAEWFAHQFILCFIKDNMLTILFPAGIFLRALGVRAGGNALMGVALSLYFVYPYMMVQAGQIITGHVEAELEGNQHVLNCLANEAICCLPSGTPSTLGEPYIPNGPNWRTDLSDRVSQEKVLNGGFYINFAPTPGTSFGGACFYNTAVGRVVKQAIGGMTLGGLGGLAAGTLAGKGLQATSQVAKNLNLSFVSIFLLLPAIGLTLAFFYDTVYFMFVVSIVLPIFMIFISLTFAKEIAKVLGTEIDLSALEKLI